MFVLLLFGFLFGCLLGALPFTALVTLLFSRMLHVFRVILAMVLSFVMMVVITWLSSEHHEPWIIGYYFIAMVVLNGVAFLFLFIRWLASRG